MLTFILLCVMAALVYIFILHKKFSNFEDALVHVESLLVHLEAILEALASKTK